MIVGRALAAALILVLPAGCSEHSVAPAAILPSEGTLLEVRPARIPSPDGSRTLLFGGEDNRALTLSTGFLKKSRVGSVETPSRLSWAPDSRHFYVNDSGSASWSTFRLWRINPRSEAVETATIHHAAVAELGRRNGCASVPQPDATTHGMGWAEDGAQVYVLAQVRRQTGACMWTGVDYILVLADVSTGRLLEVEQEAAARRRYPNLPWAPVTAP